MCHVVAQGLPPQPAPGTFRMTRGSVNPYSASMRMKLDHVTDALDVLFELDTAAPDAAMSRHVPQVYDEVGVDWRRHTQRIT
nr:hypothetical protein GCM10020092_087800 [Actinoplanes digitatis]